MKNTRLWVLLFAGIALVASVASLYVHYHLIKDVSYTSFCNVSETVSCEAVYESAYGTVRGVPVAAGGVIWSALVCLLAYRGMRQVRSPEAADVAEYIFVLSVIGLAVVLFLGYASYFVLHKICLLCTATYAGVFGVFFVAAGATTMPFRTLPGRIFRDMRSLVASPVPLTLALLWLVASGSLVAFFPREAPAAEASSSPASSTTESSTSPAAAETAPAAATPAAAPVATPAAAPAQKGLPPAQQAEFEKWFVAQPHTPIAVPTDGAKVVIVKFNDYQCPPCRQTFMQYKSVLAKFKTTHPGEVKFITKDFPLDPECNSGGPHQAACEAAAAVRMARLKGRAEALEDWLFDNQPAITPDLVRQGVKQVAGVTDFDARYQSVLEQVRTDVKYGQSLGVGRTPTFFINGRKVEGGLEPAFFEAAIEYELAHAPGSKP